MKIPSLFEKFVEPKSVHLESLTNREMITIVAGGIINPFGPTLNAIVLDGIIQTGNKLPILNINLNPFSQEAKEIGVAHIGDVWDPATDLKEFFSPPVLGSCPTLLLPSTLFDADGRININAIFISSFDNAYSVLEKVRRFPGDPWNRVQNDVDSIGDTLKSIDSQPETKKSVQSIKDDEAIELARNLLDPSNLKAEIKAFMYAWNGSIEFQGGSALVNRAMSLEEFIKIFSTLAVSCDMP